MLHMCPDGVLHLRVATAGTLRVACSDCALSARDVVVLAQQFNLCCLNGELPHVYGICLALPVLFAAD